MLCASKLWSPYTATLFGWRARSVFFFFGRRHHRSLWSTRLFHESRLDINSNRMKPPSFSVVWPRVPFSWHFRMIGMSAFDWSYSGIRILKITPTIIWILSGYKGEFQHRFRSKCYRYIFLNLPQEKNLEAIPSDVIPELGQPNAPR